MAQIEGLVADILSEVGISQESIITGSSLELPGYFRPEKKWDLLVVQDENLVAAIEFKSQAGPSFGNNFNNRCEEAIGNAVDLWTAFRENGLGRGWRPFLGFFFLLEDCSAVRNPISLKEPHFSADAVFAGASYADRYETMCRRLLQERHYDGACLTLATKSTDSPELSHPSEDLSFARFVTHLRGAARTFLESR